MGHKHHHHHNKYKGRRGFIKQMSCAALGSATFLSTINSLRAANAAAISNSAVMLGGEYKALVCFMMSGGNDSFNMLVPRGSAEYAEYATTRTNQALDQNELLPINPITSDGKSYGLHPAMTNMQNLFESEDLAFISNVGTLAEPLSREQYEQGTAGMPLGLFSHSDQQRQWQTAIPTDRSSLGWGGKIADLMYETNTNQNISMNISLSGSNTFQTGNSFAEFSIHPEYGISRILGYSDNWQSAQLRAQAIDNMLDAHHTDIFKKSYIDILKNAKNGSEDFIGALDNVTPFTTQFSYNDISQSMHMIAKTIKSRDVLGMKRQIFFVNFDGWDHHDEVLQSQNEMLGIVDVALGEFKAAMDEINMNDCVTTFGVSEFGRTLTSNGNGTDHAWGGNVFVMGGAVKGRDIYGTFPSLELNSELEIGGGVLIPTISTDSYFAELSKWFGVSNTDLPIILPNVGNFYNTAGTDLPIGFMDI